MTSDLDELVEAPPDPIPRARGTRRVRCRTPSRWSIERLWIHAGNLASDLESGLGPDSVVSDLVGVRVVYAHIWPSNLDPNRVWEDSQEVHDLLAQLTAR